MTIDNFIPTIWHGALLKNLDDLHVYKNACNREYEGDIKAYGDTVKINSIGDVTIKSYTKNSTIDAPEILDDSQQILVIDQQKYFNFAIDDIDERQQNVDAMDAAMERAAWGLAEVVDNYIAASLAANAANVLSAVTVGTGAADDDAYEVLVDLGVALDENNVPDGSRWIFVPPWYHGLLLKDPRFVSFGTDRNRANLRGDPIGEAAGFTIYRTNNAPDSSSAKVLLAGYKGAVTFAEQINKVEAFRPQNQFADAMKGLHLYGMKVTRPYALAKVNATRAS